MQDKNFFRHAVFFEGGLGILAILIGWLFGMDILRQIKLGNVFDWGIAVLATIPMIVAYFILEALPFECIKRVDELVHAFFNDYMRHLSWLQTAIVAALAGFGEELLFRGLLQDGLLKIISGYDGMEPGISTVTVIILLVSLLFGMVHAVTKTYFILAALISVYFGFLYWFSDNLLIPLSVHGLYDFFVFCCLKLDRRR